MSHQGALRQHHSSYLLLIVFALLCAFLCITFFLSQLYLASQKPLWLDETKGLFLNARNQNYFHLLLNGASGQASPAPLDYLIQRFFDQIKDKVSYFHLFPEVYYRLFPNLITCYAAVGVIFIMAFDILKNREVHIRFLQLFILLAAVFAFLFDKMPYYYAAEARPYALWNVLWFLILATSLSVRRCSWVLWGLLVLLAFSATASLFQLASLVAAFITIETTEGKDFKKVLKENAKLFLVPLLVCGYYILQTAQFDLTPVGGTWEDFLSFWRHESDLIPLMVLAIVLCCFNRENRKYAVAPLAMLFLFLMAPLIFWLTQLKGNFYAERQYIYLSLTYSVFLLTLLACVPVYLRSIKSKSAVVFIVIFAVIIGSIFGFRPKAVGKFNDSLFHAEQVLRDGLLLKQL